MCSIRHVTVTGWLFSTALSVKCVSHGQTAELEGLRSPPLWSVTGHELVPRPLLPHLAQMLQGSECQLKAPCHHKLLKWPELLFGQLNIRNEKTTL